ncbi:MAG: NADH-quinone oxidoreductase subunit M [Candidatus Korobacteraceae bacterium]
MYNHILSIILFTPLVGAALLLLVPKENKDAIRWIANIFAFLGFAVSLPLIPWFWALKERAGFQFVEGTPNSWIPSIGAGYVIGIDGISFLLIMLTTLLGAISILSSWNAIQDRVKEYYIWFLVLQVGMLGVFMANDMFLFFVFWEAMLVPMYLLIGIWGGPRKLYAAIKFFLYTLFGSVLMLLGILFLYFHHHTLTGVYTFYLPDLYATAPKIGGHAAIWLFFAFFLGFAIKVPMFPFHTWLPDAHVEAPTAGSVILAGVLLKMGTYGLIRFSLPFFPAVAMTPWVRQFMITLSLIGIIYGALVSLMQKDMKKLVAYSSVSHLGFCTLGIFALSPLGLSGSVIQQINHGISTGALFLIVGILYERRHTREISEYGGISNVMPVYATITLIMFMSSMGLPLLNGFVGEFTILQGTFMENKAWAAWAVPGVILAAAYLLWLYQRVFFGPVNNPKNEKLLDLSARELATFIPLVAIAFWIGLYPKPLFQILSTPINNLVATVRPDYPGLNVNKPVLATQPVSTPQAGPPTTSFETQESVIPTEGPSALSGGTCCLPATHRGASEKQVLRLRAFTTREDRESQRQGGRSAQDDTAMKVHAATVTTANAQLALANTK